MTDPALRPDACDVCAGRVKLADVGPGVVTCSQHFLDSLFPEDSGRPAPEPRIVTCSRCGWPVARTVPSCKQHGR